MYYTDIHSHMLCGVDDGAENESMMYEMLDMAYRGGTRTICFTPHYQPKYYGDNREASQNVFDRLKDYAKIYYPDMSLHLANELGYYTDCLPAVSCGACRSIGGKYLLMDFMPGTPFFTIHYAMEEMLSSGHNVILAHVERYGALEGKEKLLEEWERRGALFQVNASAFAYDTEAKEKKRVKKLMRRALIHMVASDAHNITDRPPMLNVAEEVITSRFGADIARLLLSEFPRRVLHGERI